MTPGRFGVALAAVVASHAWSGAVITLHAQSTPADDSARASLAYLRTAMDQFHNRFPVYDDVSSAGNHFHAYAKIPAADAAVAIDGSWTGGVHSGATAIRCAFTRTTATNFGGFYFQNGTLTSTVPQPNFGTTPNAGVDLTGATALTFWARGEHGGEQIEFFMAGVGRDAATGAPNMPYPDSSPRRPALGTLTTLTTAWQQITIDVRGLDLTYVLGGFGWVAAAANNPFGAVFYLDDIEYQLNQARVDQRLAEPRFIRSFTTLPLQPDPFDANKDDDIDFVLRNTAFTYDNALAVLAFLAARTSDGLRRAGLIGDALVYATRHDRFFNDNRPCGGTMPIDAMNGARVRNAYGAADIALPSGWTSNGRSGTVPTPGFYVDAQQTFYEIEQASIDTGNNAWAMIALTALYQRTQRLEYLDTACKLGNFVRTFRSTAGQFRGFRGGTMDPESSSPTPRAYASSEHNLDLYAAFTTLFRLTGAPEWRDAAQDARAFVEAMWDAARGCYLAGTLDPDTRNANTGQLPLDVQAWSVLAVTDAFASHPDALTCAEVHHRNVHDGFSGFDFNDDGDAVWFEGTGQMAVAYAAAARGAQAESLRQELRRAQQTAPFGDGRGLAAAGHDALTTGFDFKYFRRLHVAATAWNVFAQLAFNPFSDFGGLPFTDNLLIAGVPSIRAVHVTELRARIDALRARFNRGAFSWTDPTLTPGSATIRAQHIADLRTALMDVYDAAGRARPTFTDGTITSILTVVRAVHIAELRAAVAALE